MPSVNFFALDVNTFKNLDYQAFEVIFNLMLKYKHKLFDDEYLKSDKPYIQRVYEIIEAHIPYFWLFFDNKSGEVIGFSYFYDIIPNKTLIHTVSATVCFEKNAWGLPALTGAKKLILHAFSDLNIYKIKAECWCDNHYMPNFLTKLGFEHEATLKNEAVVENQPKNLEIWSLFNPKFNFISPKNL